MPTVTDALSRAARDALSARQNKKDPAKLSGASRHLYEQMDKRQLKRFNRSLLDLDEIAITLKELISAIMLIDVDLGWLRSKLHTEGNTAMIGFHQSERLRRGRMRQQQQQEEGSFLAELMDIF